MPNMSDAEPDDVDWGQVLATLDQRFPRELEICLLTVRLAASLAEVDALKAKADE